MADHQIEEETKIAATLKEEASKVTLVASDEDVADNDKVSSEQTPGAAQPQSKSAQSKQPANNCSFKMGDLYAEGSASRLYHASHDLMEGEFSLKLISQDLYRTEAAAQRILRSLQVVSEVANPHLATYYESGRLKDGSIFLVSEHLKGRTLKDMIAEGELLNSQRFLEIFRQVCQALKSLHARDVVHGDLKPSNIFLIDAGPGHDFVKLVDYGIANAFTEDERLEYLKLLSMSGCPNYMSPEQCLSFGLDARSDIYSMGLVMHEALCGSPLVDGHSQVHALLKQLNLKPASLNDSGSQVSDSIEKIVAKCLQKNRSARYFAIEDLELELELAASDVSSIPGLAESKHAMMRNIPLDLNAAAEEQKEKSKRRRKRLIVAGIVGTVAVGSICVAVDLRKDSTAARHKSEQELSFGMRILGQSMQPAVYVDPNNILRDASPPFKFHSALRHFKIAEDSARRAIWLYKLENLANHDHKYKHNLSNLQTFMGEVYLKDQFMEDGTKRDRNEWYTRTNYSAIADLASLKLYPAFPGLQPTPSAFPDYSSANNWFDKASRTIKRNYDLRDLNLLWDRAYTKFQLDNNNPEVIELHRKIIETIQAHQPSDKNTLLMTYRNIGLIYLLNGEFGKAVHELKEARRIDEDLNKIPGPYSAEIKAELAYAFLKEGKFDVAEKIARENLGQFGSTIDQSPVSVSPALMLNSQVLMQALKAQGKTEEARMFNYFPPVSPPFPGDTFQ